MTIMKTGLNDRRRRRDSVAADADDGCDMGRNIARSRRPPQACLIVAALLVAAILAACATPEPPAKRTTIQEINARAAAGVFSTLGDGRNCIDTKWLNRSLETSMPVDGDGNGYILKVTNTCRSHGVTVFWCVGDECGRFRDPYYPRAMNLSPYTKRRFYVSEPDLRDISFRACRGYIDIRQDDDQYEIDPDTGAITCRVRDPEAWPSRAQSRSLGAHEIHRVYRIPYWYGRPDLGEDR